MGCRAFGVSCQPDFGIVCLCRQVGENVQVVMIAVRTEDGLPRVSLSLRRRSPDPLAQTLDNLLSGALYEALALDDMARTHNVQRIGCLHDLPLHPIRSCLHLDPFQLRLSAI